MDEHIDEIGFFFNFVRKTVTVLIIITNGRQYLNQLHE